MKVATYRDGGTRSFKQLRFDLYFKQSDAEVCQDNRIGSKNKGVWFLGYPEIGRPLTEEERVFIVQEIMVYLGKEYKLAKYIYEDIRNNNLDCSFKDDFQNIFTLKMASSSKDLEISHYISDNYTIIDENGYCTLKNDKNSIFTGSLQECFNYYLENGKDERNISL